jgi:hypothetical protein
VVGVNCASDEELTAFEFTEGCGWQSLQLNVGGTTTNTLTADSCLQPFWTNADVDYQSDGSAMITGMMTLLHPNIPQSFMVVAGPLTLTFASWIERAPDPTQCSGCDNRRQYQ